LNVYKKAIPTLILFHTLYRNNDLGPIGGFCLFVFEGSDGADQDALTL